MNQKDQPAGLPHFVIIGGGFAGLALVNKLKHKPVRVTLIDKHNYHTFQPLLYQLATGGLGPDAIAYPLRKITGRVPNIDFHMAEVSHIELSGKKITTTTGTFNYDFLCIATGSETNFFGNANLEANCMKLKSIPDALDLRSEVLQELEKAMETDDPEEIERILRFVVVGGGPTGVETAGALAEMRINVLPADYPEMDPRKMQVHLIESAPRLLSSMHESSSRGALKALEKLGVQVMLNTTVASYDGSVIQLKSGESLKTETVIWSAGVKGKTIDGLPGEKTGKGNRYKVDEYNQVENLPGVFAIGDIALMTSDPRYPGGHPMIAPVAIQQADLLARNLFRLFRHEPLKPFVYFDKGAMATIGRHMAVFESFGIRCRGYIAWLGWMFLHLILLVGYRNRIIVLVNWMWNYFTYQRAIRIITRPFTRK